MKWPWSRQPTNRGTLTLLSGGQFILGLPADVTAQQTQVVRELVRHLADEPSKSLILPFPVDVDDKRG